MRRLFLFLMIAGLVAVPAAEATVPRTPGNVYLQLSNGAGSANVRYVGNLLGHVRRGRILATGNVIVSGYDAPPRHLRNGLVEYHGRYLGFRTPASAWRLRVTGRGINASGFVRGCMTLNGRDLGDPGDFKIDQEGRTSRWPRAATRYRLGWGC
jgi:hypothetical protein